MVPSPLLNNFKVSTVLDIWLASTAVPRAAISLTCGVSIATEYQLLAEIFEPNACPEMGPGSEARRPLSLIVSPIINVHPKSC